MRYTGLEGRNEGSMKIDWQIAKRTLQQQFWAAWIVGGFMFAGKTGTLHPDQVWRFFLLTSVGIIGVVGYVRCEKNELREYIARRSGNWRTKNPQICPECRTCWSYERELTPEETAGAKAVREQQEAEWLKIDAELGNE